MMESQVKESYEESTLLVRWGYSARVWKTNYGRYMRNMGAINTSIANVEVTTPLNNTTG